MMEKYFLEEKNAVDGADTTCSLGYQLTNKKKALIQITTQVIDINIQA